MLPLNAYVSEIFAYLVKKKVVVAEPRHIEFESANVFHPFERAFVLLRTGDFDWARVWREEDGTFSHELLWLSRVPKDRVIG